MTVRITQNMINNQLMRNLNNNMQRMSKTQDQLSSGMRINKPSDDPVGITFGLRYRSELKANEQYQKNVDSTVSWLDFTDSTLGQAGNVLQRVRELAVQGSNGTNPASAMESIKLEAIQLKNQLVDIGNSQLNGKFVFNGQNTDQPPYPDVTNAATQDTDGYPIRYEIGAGVEMSVNITGNDVFGSKTETDNTFKVMDDLISALNANDYTTVSNLIGKINTRMEKFTSARAEIGARSNRIELVQSRLQELNTNLTALQSKTEDADMPKLITDMKMDESVYQASLSVGSQLIRPSLLDFLR